MPEFVLIDISYSYSSSTVKSTLSESEIVLIFKIGTKIFLSERNKNIE